MTRPQIGDPDPTPVLDSNWDYCWAPAFGVVPQRAVFCCWERDHGPERPHVWIGPGGVVGHVWAVFDPQPAGRVWGPHETYPMCVGPRKHEDADGWTNELTARGRALSVNRQCSIGWHAECSDPAGDECRCLCHAYP